MDTPEPVVCTTKLGKYCRHGHSHSAVTCGLCPRCEEDETREQREARIVLEAMGAKADLQALAAQVGGGHYKSLSIQPVEYIYENRIPFIEGCIIKYATRWREKGGVEDLKKIVHFAEILMQFEERAEPL